MILAISLTGGVMAIASNNAVTQANTVNAVVPLTGHVSIIGHDANGNIKKYVETDNLIMNNGENCISKMLFAGASQTTNVVCTGAITEPFTDIRMGTVSGTVNSDSVFIDQTQSNIDTQDVVIGDKTISWINASDGSVDSNEASVTISQVFTRGGSGFVGISSIGLFNGTDESTNGIFAIQKLPAIYFFAADSTITFQWTIDIGD